MQGECMLSRSLTDVVPELSQVFLHFPIRPLIPLLVHVNDPFATGEDYVFPIPLDIPRTLAMQYQNLPLLPFI